MGGRQPQQQQLLISSLASRSGLSKSPLASSTAVGAGRGQHRQARAGDRQRRLVGGRQQQRQQSKQQPRPQRRPPQAPARLLDDGVRGQRQQANAGSVRLNVLKQRRRLRHAQQLRQQARLLKPRQATRSLNALERWRRRHARQWRQQAHRLQPRQATRRLDALERRRQQQQAQQQQRLSGVGGSRSNLSSSGVKSAAGGLGPPSAASMRPSDGGSGTLNGGGAEPASWASANRPPPRCARQRRWLQHAQQRRHQVSLVKSQRAVRRLNALQRQRQRQHAQ